MIPRNFIVTEDPVKVEQIERNPASITSSSAEESSFPVPETKTSNHDILWEHHFSRLGPDSNRGICLECGKKLACTQGNTTGLSRHLQTHHKDQWQEYLGRRVSRDQGREANRARIRGIRNAEAASLRDAAAPVIGGNQEDLLGS